MQEHRYSTFEKSINKVGLFGMGAPAQITDFLLRLRAWQYSITTPGLDAEGVAKVLKLRPGSAQARCNTMLYDDRGVFYGMCQRLCGDKSPWCILHDGAHTMGRDVREQSVVPLFHLPRYLAYKRVTMVGYFEHRWKSDDWACSFDTLRDQAMQATGNHANTLGTLRFVGFVDEEYALNVSDLKAIFTGLRNTDTVSVLQGVHILLVELLIGLVPGDSIRCWIHR